VSDSHINRPGKPSISYRVASHSGFLKRMQERLHLQKTRHHPDSLYYEDADTKERQQATRPLRSLNALSSDDPAIALLDAWATVADVLTFYQERLANEGFIRTATERGSVLHLARSVGYELLPGAAASCPLVFTVEDADGSPPFVVVPPGTRVDSIPEPGKLPLTFETVKPLVARAEYNVLLPERWRHQLVGDGITRLWLKGTSTLLTPGDSLLFIGSDRQKDWQSQAWQLRTLTSVSRNLEIDNTEVEWSEPLVNLGPPRVLDESGLLIFSFRERNATLFGSTAPDWRTLPEEMKKSYEDERWRGNWPSLGLKKVKGKYAIDLDGLYSRILRHSWMVLIDPNFGPHLCRVSEVSTVNRSDYSLNARVTRVLPEIEPDLSSIDVRQTVVLAHSEPVALAEVKRTLPPQKTEIELDSLVCGLDHHKELIVCGKRMRILVLAENLSFYPENDKRALQPGDQLRAVAPPKKSSESDLEWITMDAEGYVGLLKCRLADVQLQSALEKDEPVCELSSIISTSRNERRTTLILESPLSNFYDPQTMEISANVVSATHGETVREVLGSGDGTKINQSFALKKRPLTFTSADNPRGGISTLRVYVDSVLWEESDSFVNLDGSAERYVLEIDDNGSTRIVFGDGKKGARLPTGEENITAVYRSGLGIDGNVPSASLSLMPNRPPGVRSVTNPIAASGAASPETSVSAKHHAPKTLMTLNRLVSLRDFESFAKSFVGIGKALATEILMEQGKMVHITVCSNDGSQVDTGSDLFKNLNRAIQNRSRSIDRFMVSGYRLLTFRIEASLAIDRLHVAEEVKKQSIAALRQEFSVSNRSFAQDVTASEILVCLQKVEGVVFARIDILEFDNSGIGKKMQEAGFTESIRLKSLPERISPVMQSLDNSALPEESHDKTNQILRARAAAKKNEEIVPAEILMINPDPAGIKLKILELQS